MSATKLDTRIERDTSVKLNEFRQRDGFDDSAPIAVVQSIGWSRHVKAGIVCTAALASFGCALAIATCVGTPDAVHRAAVGPIRIAAGLALMLALVTLILSLDEAFRQFEFFASSDTLSYVSRCGLMRIRREWKISEIAGVVLHYGAFYQSPDPYARVLLVSEGGGSVPILPFRPVRTLATLDRSLKLLIQKKTLKTNAPVLLGFGISLVESGHSLRIAAAPVSPWEIPRSLYLLATGTAVIDPIITLVCLAAVQTFESNLLYKMLATVVGVCQALFVTLAALVVRARVKMTAESHYDISIDQFGATFVLVRNSTSETHRCELRSICGIYCNAMMVSGNVAKIDHDVDPSILRIEIETTEGRRIECLCGRPVQQTLAVFNHLRRALRLSGGRVKGDTEARCGRAE